MKAKKSLGQNFLVDSNVAGRILRNVAPANDEIVIEVGPGHGALTKLLVEQVGHLIAIELDHELIPELQTNFAQPQVTIIEADILETNIAQLIEQTLTNHSHLQVRARVVANLPYYISTAVISHFLAAREYLRDLTVMLQREVAERIASLPGGRDYGMLSVIAQLYCETKILFHVKPGCFRPVPKVDSSILQLTVREQPLAPVSNEELLTRVVQAAFSQRRKTIANSLKANVQVIAHAFAEPIDNRLLADNIGEILNLANIAGERRAETLTSAEFAHLSNQFFQFLQDS